MTVSVTVSLPESVADGDVEFESVTDNDAVCVRLLVVDADTDIVR